MFLLLFKGTVTSVLHHSSIFAVNPMTCHSLFLVISAFLHNFRKPLVLLNILQLLKFLLSVLNLLGQLFIMGSFAIFIRIVMGQRAFALRLFDRRSTLRMWLLRLVQKL